MIKRLAFGLLATATFVVVPAAAAFAGPPNVFDYVPGSQCELTCTLEQICAGNDENLDGRVCVPFGQSEVVKFLTTAVDENI